MDEDKRTQFAMAAVDFAEIFNQAFSKPVVPGFQLKLTAPDGQSTGGGVQALQHVTMSNLAEGFSLVVATVNNIERKAELRPFERVAKQYEERFEGRLFAVDRQQFDALQQRLSNFFKSQSMEVSQATAPAPGAGAARPQASSGSSMWIILVIVAVLLAAAGLSYYFFLYKG
jgi:hypothetical protein